PMDKAGAYGIQEGFDVYVERIDGEEDTVIGFPMTRLLRT
ncbi:MAG: Maf family protein, partial [Firmicutes bacterium]|nr:Maf family protein [Bacillota bacterium]